jgi:hypothetical protein
MPTVVEIINAARSLSPAQIGELRREVERLDKESRAIHLEARAPGDVACRLTRLADQESSTCCGGAWPSTGLP